MGEHLKTDSLRAAAPDWNLAGDKSLLHLLQGVHENIISKCQDTNNKLQEMVSALDEASISLQNVNNRFMSLSNSKFVENRVYSDDTDVSTEKIDTIEEPDPVQHLLTMNEGLQTLESFHEVITILNDSDSDSDSADDDQGEILKPKDLYADRPLPYIIGSFDWKNKWHVGLVPEDSDSNSSIDEEKHMPWENESYVEDDRADVNEPYCPETTSNISLEVDTSISHPTPTQSEIAAKLAKKFGACQVPQEKTTEIEKPSPTTKVENTYRPHQSTAGPIFSDEPPPIDDTQWSETEDEKEDIFEEIKKSQGPAIKDTKNIGIFNDNDFVENKPTHIEKPAIFDDEEPELFKKVEPDSKIGESTIKKPVGAISLFGAKGTESIGAAILQRNRKKSSSSEESLNVNNESKANLTIKETVVNKKVMKSSDNEKTIEKDTKNPNKDTKSIKENDIFDELFARNDKSKAKKVITKDIQQEAGDTGDDLFNDNIFDEIDDIFNKNVVTTKSKEIKTKSVFDDVDDLFSDIGIEKNDAVIVKTKNNTMSKKLFDSDDELFSDDVDIFSTIKINKENKNTAVTSTNKLKSEDHKKETKIKEQKSIFDSDDELFVNDNKIQIKNSKVLPNPAEVKNQKDLTEKIKKEPNTEEQKSIFDSDDDLFINDSKIPTTNNKVVNPTQRKNLFGDDDDDNDEDIFASSKLQSKDNDISSKKSLSNITEVSNKASVDTFVDVSDINMNNSANIKNLKESDKINANSKDTSIKTITNDLDNNVINVNDNSYTDANHNDDHLKQDEVDHFAAVKTKLIDENKEDFNKLSNDADIADSINKTKIAKENSKNKPSLFGGDMESEEDLFKLPTSVKEDVEEIYVNNADKEIKINESKEELSESQSSVTSSDNNVNKVDLLDQSTNIETEKLDVNIVESENKKEETKEPDLFDSIFTDQPPDFKKPFEPKKSQNINALFDDDSDDENLFLKTNDIFTDELPDTSENNANMFSIFHDEPPALDDFSSLEVENEENHKEIVKTVVTTKNETKDTQPIMKEPKTNEIKKEQDKPDNVDGIKEEKVKKIGKLKPMNLNINVNTLLPGASPKKVSNITKDATDTFISQQNKLEDIKIVNKDILKEPVKSKDLDISSGVAKSVSFDGGPNSSVLDNKISKERAKIRVKRRPSTRRARIEAVRKSAISFDETDSQDNDNEDVGTDKNANFDKEDIYANINKNDETNNDLDLNNEIQKDEMSNNNLEYNKNKEIEEKELKNSENDLMKAENSKIKKDKNDEPSTKILNINDDDVYIFREPDFSTDSNLVNKNDSNITIPSSDILKDTKIENEFTKIKTYNKKTEVKDEIFNDNTDLFDGDDLFKNKIEIKSNTEHDANIFKDVKKEKLKPQLKLFDDMSDDDDLFGEKKGDDKKDDLFNKSTVKNDKKNVFGEESEVDDIFGAGSNKLDAKATQKMEKTAETKSLEPEFKDPLSLFDDDD